MKEKDLWTTFEKTGSIVDYLNYKNIHGTLDEQKIGEQDFESDSNCNRNDTVRDTYR